jgi:ubiquinone/menaquinone biosynthesis C-methylase UbiE
VIDLLREYKVTSLLDMGCGSGPNYMLMKQKGIMPKYKGTDLSYNFIEQAEKLYPEAEWEVQDIRDIPEKDNSWDCVATVHVMDHVKEYEKAIQEIHRVTSRLVIMDIWRPLSTTSETKVEDKSDWSGGKWENQWLVTYNKKHLESIFKKVGFEIVYEENFPNEPQDHHSFIYVLKKV